MKTLKYRIFSVLLVLLLFLNIIDMGIFRDSFLSFRAVADARDYPASFSWNLRELVPGTFAGDRSYKSITSGDTTTIKDKNGNVVYTVVTNENKKLIYSGNNTGTTPLYTVVTNNDVSSVYKGVYDENGTNNKLRDISLTNGNADLSIIESADEPVQLRTVFYIDPQTKTIPPGHITFTIDGLNDLVRSGVLSLNDKDPDVTSVWKIEHDTENDKWTFTNQKEIQSNSETVFTWNFDSRAGINPSNIELETRCIVYEDTINEDGSINEKANEIPISTNSINLHYESIRDDYDVRIVCQNPDEVDVNNLNTDFDWHSFYTMVGLKGIKETAVKNQQYKDITDDQDGTADDESAMYIVQDKATQESNRHARGVGETKLFIELSDLDTLNRANDIMILDSSGNRVTIVEEVIDGKTCYGFYDFQKGGERKAGEAYGTTYRVGIRNDAMQDGKTYNVQLTAHYLVQYQDETEVTDITDTAAHKVSKNETQTIGGSGNYIVKYNNYEINRSGEHNGINYDSHAKHYNPANQWLYENMFSGKTVRYSLEAKTSQETETTDSGKVIKPYDLIYEDGAPTLFNIYDKAELERIAALTTPELPTTEAQSHTLTPSEYDFTQITVRKLIKGSTVTLTEDGTGFDFVVYGWSEAPNNDAYHTWKDIGNGNTATDVDIYLPSGIDKIQLVVKNLEIRADVTAYVYISYNVDPTYRDMVFIDTISTAGTDNKYTVDTNKGTYLQNEFKREKYIIGSNNENYEPNTPNLTLTETATAASNTWVRQSVTEISSNVGITNFGEAFSPVSSSDQYLPTTITAGGKIKSDSDGSVRRFAVYSKLPHDVELSDGWDKKIRETLQFSAVDFLQKENIDAEEAKKHISISYDASKRCVICEFDFDYMPIDVSQETSISFSYPAEISVAKMNVLTDKEFETASYVTVLDSGVRVSNPSGTALLTATDTDNPTGHTAVRASKSVTYNSSGSYKDSRLTKKVASYYNDWVYEAQTEVDGSNAHHYVNGKMTSEYSYKLDYFRTVSQQETVKNPMILDIVEGLNKSRWDGNVKSVTVPKDYPVGVTPAVYYLVENNNTSPVDSNAADPINRNYKKSNKNITAIVNTLRGYDPNNSNSSGNTNYTEDLQSYTTFVDSIKNSSGIWTKVETRKETDNAIEFILSSGGIANIYAVAILYEGQCTINNENPLELVPVINMIAPPLSNQSGSNINNNRVTYNEAYAFGASIGNTGSQDMPLCSKSDETLVILRHDIELAKVSSKNPSMRLTGAKFTVFGMEDNFENDEVNNTNIVQYYDLDSTELKRLFNQPVDSTGILKMNLAPGIYNYLETQAPRGYTRDEHVYRFRVLADKNAVYYYTIVLKTQTQKESEYMIVNEKEVESYDLFYNGQTKVDANKAFYVWNSEGNRVKKYSDSEILGTYEYSSTVSESDGKVYFNDGKLTLKYLPAGTYTINTSDIDADKDADGYEFSVADNSSITLCAYQKKLLTSNVKYKLYKGDADNMNADDEPMKLTGSNGEYTVSDNGTVTEIVPDSAGKVQINGLTGTDYYLMLEETPTGYEQKTATKLKLKANDSSDDNVILYATEQLVVTDKLVVKDDPLQTAKAEFKKIDGTTIGGTHSTNYGNLINDAIYNMYTVDDDGSLLLLYFTLKADGDGQQTYAYSGTKGKTGAVFELQTGMKVAETAADAATYKGKIFVSGLPYGTYIIKEQSAPKGYQLSSVDHYFRVSPQTIDDENRVVFGTTTTTTDEGTETTVNTTMELSDNEVLSTIVLKKKDLKNQKKYLKNAQYNLYQLVPNTNSELSDADYLAAAKEAVNKAKGDPSKFSGEDEGKYWIQFGSGRTDVTGTIRYSGLPFGTYLVYEISAPQGYTWNNDNSKWETWTTKNTVKNPGQIIIISRETVTGNSEIQKVNLTDDEGNNVRDENGELVYIDEITYYDFYVSHLDDRKLGDVQLLKTDSADKKPLTDANFSLYKVNFTENEKKVALIKFDPNKYTEDFFTNNTKTLDALIEEEEIILSKTDFLNSEHFTTNSNGDVVSVATDEVVKQNLQTNDDPSIGSTVLASGLDWGVYYFYEMKAPAGYQKYKASTDDSTEYPLLFTIDAGNVSETIQISMTNDKTYGEVWLYKQAEDKLKDTNGNNITPEAHEKLFGAKFQLYDKNDELVKSVPLLRLGGLNTTATDVNAKGRKEFPVKEIIVTDNTHINVKILDGNTEHIVTITYDVSDNDKKAKGTTLTINVDDAFNNTYGNGYKNGTDFRLANYVVKESGNDLLLYEDTGKYRTLKENEKNFYNSNSIITDEYVTVNAGGRLNVRGLDWGSYYFRETVPPSGYGLAEDVLFNVNAYNCDSQFVKCEDPPATAAIIIDKEIPDKEYFDAYGEPTFMFKVYELKEAGTGDTIAYTFKENDSANEKEYAKTGTEYTLAIHMKDIKGTAMVSVPAKQYLIEEMPVSRYECYGLEVVDTAKTDYTTESANMNSTTSKNILTQNKYETNSTTYKAFCDLSGATSPEVYVFRVKYQNRIKRYDNFSQVDFADNYIPGETYITSIKPIYTPLVPAVEANSSSKYVYTINLKTALASTNKDFVVKVTYNNGKVSEFTADDLAKMVVQNQDGGNPFESVTYNKNTGELTLTTVSDLSGQTHSVNFGYKKDGTLDTYNTEDQDMIVGVLSLTFAPPVIQTRKRVIYKNDADNRSQFGTGTGADRKTSIAVNYSLAAGETDHTKATADLDITADANKLNISEGNTGYEFKYWYLLDKDGKPVKDTNSTEGEPIKFTDETAIKAFIFNGTLPDDAGLDSSLTYFTPSEIDKLSAFTFQAEVGENSLPKAKLMTGPVVHNYMDNIANSSGNHSRIKEITISSSPPWENGHTDYVLPTQYNLGATQYMAISVTYPKAVSADGSFTEYEVYNDEYPNIIYAWCEWNNGASTYAIRWYTDDPVGIMANENSSELFREMNSLYDVDVTSIMNTSLVTDMSNMFRLNSQYTNIISLDLSNWDTSSVTTMEKMFYAQKGLKHIQWDGFNGSSLVNIDYMFNQTNIADIDFLYEADMSKVQRMEYAFGVMSNFDNATDVNGVTYSGYLKNNANLVNVVQSWSGLDSIVASNSKNSFNGAGQIQNKTFTLRNGKKYNFSNSNGITEVP